MTTHVSPYAVANLLMRGLAEHQAEVGKGQSADNWLCDRKTAPRWIESKDPCQPSLFAIGATIAHEHNATGASATFGALGRLLGGLDGRAEDVDRDCLAALSEFGRLIAENAEALKHDMHVDAKEGARLLPVFERVAVLARTIAGGLRDQQQRGAP